MKKNLIRIIYLLTAIVSIFMIFIFLGAYFYLKKATFLFTVMATLTLIAGIIMSIQIVKGNFSFSHKPFKNKKSQVIVGICIIVLTISMVYISIKESKVTGLDIIFLGILLLGGITLITSEPIELKRK